MANILTDKEIRLLDSLYGNLPEGSVSDKIYKLRKISGLGRDDFAERIGVHASTIKAWEEGIKTPTRTSINKVCAAFELDITDFN